MERGRVRISLLQKRKQAGEKFAALTAYDATMARLLETAGIEVLLVGDSVSTALLGYASTLPVTLEMMIHHTAAVSRGSQRALIVADMPFLSYQTGTVEAVKNAGRLLKEGGAAAVKVEGGVAIARVVRRLVDFGIPVMGHVGLQPQSVHQQSGYRQRGNDVNESGRIILDAIALQEAGAFAVVLESIPSALARRITAKLKIPTIGIGAGPDCDGQILVCSDLLGYHTDSPPPFARQYANVAAIVVAAVRAYVSDVRSRQFPSPIASRDTVTDSEESPGALVLNTSADLDK